MEEGGRHAHWVLRDDKIGDNEQTRLKKQRVKIASIGHHCASVNATGCRERS